MGLDSLCHLEHRGASGAEVNTGDGAGILIQIPDAFYRAVVRLRAPGRGRLRHRDRLPADRHRRGGPTCQGIERLAADEDLAVIGWREVPIDDSQLGSIARSAMPSFHQVFVAGPQRRRCQRPGARTTGLHLAQAG